MIYDDSEEQSIINSSGAEEGFSDEKNDSNLETQEVPVDTVKRIKPRFLTQEEYEKQNKNYVGPNYWWKDIPEDELVKITSALVEEKNTRQYINEISESVKKDLERRGITKFIDTPITRSLQSGFDSLAGGAAQVLGTAYDIASQNNKQSILTQWGAETSMMSNYMSNYVQREKGDTNKWDDVTGPGSFLTWGLHTGAHMAPAFLPYAGWASKGLSWGSRFLLGRMGLKIAAEAAQAATVATEVSQGVRIAGTLSTTMHGVVGATTQETAALVAQQGWLSRTLGSISRGINPSKTISAINIANESTKKISLLKRFAAQSPVAFNFGASAYGQIRPNLVNSGMDYDEATYKSFVSALPQAAFAYLPAFGQLNPSWTRFLGEAATMGGVNVLMNPVQAMVDNAIDLDEPKEGETYWDYLYRKTTENVLEPFAIGALFHLMSLPSRKFGKLARLDREMKNMEDELTRDDDGPDDGPDSGPDSGSGGGTPITINGELSDNTRGTLPYFDSPNIIRDSNGNITAYRVNPSDYVSLDEVHASSILNGEQSPIDAIINDPITGTTEEVQIIPSTKSFNEKNGSTIQTTDGRTIRTENLTYKPKQENEAKFVEELDKLKAYKAELEARIIPNDANQKANNAIKEDLKKLDKAIKMVEQHLTLINSMFKNQQAVLQTIFGENFSPTVHGQQILFQYQQSLYDLLLLNKWMEDSGLSKSDLSKQYELLQKNITTLENEINTKDTVNKQIYNKITELYGLLTESDPTKSVKVEKIVNEIRELYKELKKDYEHPENLTEFTAVVNTLKQIAAYDAFAAFRAENKKKYDGSPEDAVSIDKKSLNRVNSGNVFWNVDYGLNKNKEFTIESKQYVDYKSEDALEIAQRTPPEARGKLGKQIYEKLIPFYDGLAITESKDKESKDKKSKIKYGFSNRKDETIIPHIYDEVRRFHNGFAQIKSGEKWGLVNKEGKIIVEPTYDYIWPSFEGRFRVREKGQYGFINEDGNFVIKFGAEAPFSKEERTFYENFNKRKPENQNLLDERTRAKYKYYPATSTETKSSPNQETLYKINNIQAEILGIEKNKTTREENEQVFSEIKKIKEEITKINKEGVSKKTGKLTKKATNEIDKLNAKIKKLEYELNDKRTSSRLTEKSINRIDELNKELDKLYSKLEFEIEEFKSGSYVYRENVYTTENNLYNTEKSNQYVHSTRVMDSNSYKKLANPKFRIIAGTSNKKVTLKSGERPGEYFLQIKKDEHELLKDQPTRTASQNTIILNNKGVEKKYFVRNASKFGWYLVELTGNPVLDSNIIYVETTVNRLNFYYDALVKYDKENGTSSNPIRNGEVYTVSKEDIESLPDHMQEYPDKLAKGYTKFRKYLPEQVEFGLFSLNDSQKIYDRLDFVEKGVFAEKIKKRIISSVEEEQQNKSTLNKLKRLAPRNEAYEAVYGKGNIYDKFTVLHKKLKNALGRVNKELKKTDKKVATENYFRKQLNDFIEKVKEIEKSKPKKSAVKTNNSEIFKQINIEEFNNFINKIEELETLYDSDQYRALKETDYFLTEANELFGSIKTIKENFQENNEGYSEKTQDINTVISSKRAELVKRLDAFKAILDISQKDIKKIKSKKDVDEYFSRYRGNRKEATLLDIEPQKIILKSDLALDSINNNDVSGEGRYTFNYLSSTIATIDGKDVYLKTALIQDSNSPKVKKVGEVFKHNAKFYRVLSIEKLPDLNLDTVTDKEMVARAKFEKTGMDLRKIVNNPKYEELKKKYFDDNGKFKNDFDLVTYELIETPEGNVNRVTTDKEGKKTSVYDQKINLKDGAVDALGLSKIMDNIDEMDSVLRDSFDRAFIGESINSLDNRVTEGSFNQFDRFNQNTIGNLPPRTANPPQATQQTPQATQQTRQSSMLTNPTAHTAPQAIAEQSAQQTAPEQIATQQPTSQQLAPQQSASQPIARGAEEAPRVEPRPIITNETQQVFNDGQPIDSSMPRAEEPSRPRTFERQQPLFDESATASEKPKPPQVAAGGSGRPPEPPRRPVPPDEAETSGRSGKDSFTEESESRRRMLDDAEGSKEKFTLWEKFKNWWVSDDSPLEKLVTKLQTTLEKVGKKLPDEANAFLQFSLANQRKNAAISRSSARFNGEIMEPMKKAFNQYYKTRMSSMGKKEAVKQFMVDFDLFVELRSAEDLNIAFAEWAKQEPDKVASLTPPRSVEKAKAMLDALMKREPKLYEEFVNTHDKLTRMLNESLGELVTAGILEKSVYDALVKKYKNYAPMYAYEDALNSPTHFKKFNAYNERGGIGFAGLDIALKNRLGNSDLPRGEVLQHSLQMLRKRARAVAYAPAQKALYDFVKMGIDNKIFSENFVSIIDPESGSTIDKLVESGMNYNDALLLSEGFKNNVIKRTYVDKNGNLVIKEISVPPPSDNVVPLQIFDEKGVSKKIYLAFDSKNEIAMHMAKLYNGSLDAGWMPTGVVGKAYFTVLKNWNALNTGYNPFFAVKNFSADYFDMLTNISNTPLSGKRWAITKQIPGIVKTIGKYNLLMNKFKQSGNQAAFDAAINSDPILKSYHEYYMNGGSHNFVEDNNLVINEITDNLASKLRKGTGYQGGRQILDGIANLVNIEMNSLENSIRFASYQEGLKMGLSKDVATLLGKDITANFDRKGIIARKVNGLYSYTTANIAGQSRVFKSLTGKKGLVLLTGAILAGMAQQSMYDEMDTLDSEAIPDYVKQQYMVFPASDGGYIKIRIRGLGMLFQLGRNITKLSNGDTDGLSVAKELLSSISFTGGGKTGLLQTITPTFGKPVVAVFTNESWTGSKIANEDPQGLTPQWMLSRAGANPIADNVARALYESTSGDIDLSPQDFEYLFKVYAGGAVTQSVQFAKSISEIGDENVYRPTSNPFLSPMPYGRSDIKNSSASYIYELDEKMRRTNQVIKKYLEAGDKKTAQRLINSARIPYNDSELIRLSRMRSNITEERNRYVRQSRINGTINTPEFNKKIKNFNSKQDEIIAKQANAFKRAGVIK